MRLNRYLAESGLCSRREADRRISLGEITLNGEIASLGAQVVEGDVVLCKGAEVHLVHNKIYLVIHKPRGIEVTMNTSVQENIADFINIKERVFPVGRLDKDSEGLLLMTNDGDTANAILKAANGHEKEYMVTVNKTITDAFLNEMSRGVEILETVTAPCFVERVHRNVFRIILKQGLNRQIRRMCEVLGYKVERLVRIRVMHITLDNLAIGKFRELTEHELRELLQEVQNKNEMKDEDAYE